MAVQSKLLEVLPPGYGYVIFTAVGSTFVNMWMAMNVMRARKEYNVPFPQLYSAANEKFNCIQRAHQHTLEIYPQFLLLLTIGGLQCPRIAAGAGVVYLLGRIGFALGYYTGDPEKRRWGVLGYPGLFTLLGCTLCLAVRQLDWAEYFKTSQSTVTASASFRR